MRFFSHATQQQTTQGGYLLVEILVSLSIFSLITVSATVSLLSIIDANTKAQATKAVMDNLSVAVENMSRTIRIGSDFRCGPDYNSSNTDPLCQGGTTGFSFQPQGATGPTDRVYYHFETSSDASGNISGSIYRRSKGVDIALTAPEVNITSLHFYLLGASTEPGQPRVLIAINGRAGPNGSLSTAFLVQTTVVQRLPDAI